MEELEELAAVIVVAVDGYLKEVDGKGLPPEFRLGWQIVLRRLLEEDVIEIGTRINDLRTLPQAGA